MVGTFRLPAGSGNRRHEPTHPAIGTMAARGVAEMSAVTPSCGKLFEYMSDGVRPYAISAAPILHALTELCDAAAAGPGSTIAGLLTAKLRHTGGLKDEQPAGFGDGRCSGHRTGDRTRIRGRRSIRLRLRHR